MSDRMWTHDGVEIEATTPREGRFSGLHISFPCADITILLNAKDRSRLRNLLDKMDGDPPEEIPDVGMEGGDKCTTCGGTGRSWSDGEDDMEMYYYSCPECHGTGRGH